MLTHVMWDESGLPYSTLFNDKYFSEHDGLQESHHVFCQGNRLSERFESLKTQSSCTFTIIETGFGTGLNFCAAWMLWQKHAPAFSNLHYISVERYPLSGQEVSRVLNHWPELGPYAQKIVADYRPQEGTITEQYFDNVQLSIVFKDVIAALDDINQHPSLYSKADAWFLDGFAPAGNPAMWSEEVFARMALLSKPGATIATFTVAGAVRRGLAAYGFHVEKHPGFANKKHMTAGYWEPANQIDKPNQLC